MPETTATADLVAEMEPGETFSLQQGADAGFDLSPLAIVGIDLGIQAEVTQGMEVEKLQGERIRATRTDGWSLGGKGGVAAIFGGCELVGSGDMDFEEWGTDSFLFSETLDRNARVEHGTVAMGDQRIDVDRGRYEETHKRGGFWEQQSVVSSESHQMEGFSIGDDSRFRTSSTYKGQNAGVSAFEDLHVGSPAVPDHLLDDTGTWMIETDFGEVAEPELTEGGYRFLTEREDGGWTPFGVEQARGMEDMAVDLYHAKDETDLGPFADYVAYGGGQAAEFLRGNTRYDETSAYRGEARPRERMDLPFLEPW